MIEKLEYVKDVFGMRRLLKDARKKLAYRFPLVNRHPEVMEDVIPKMNKLHKLLTEEIRLTKVNLTLEEYKGNDFGRRISEIDRLIYEVEDEIKEKKMENGII